MCDCVMGVWYLQEAEAFQGLLGTDTCKSLVHIFFAQRGTSKVQMKLKCYFVGYSSLVQE